MKIAVISTGPTIDPYMMTRSNHSEYLLIIAPPGYQISPFKIIYLPPKVSVAGKLMAQLLLQKGVDTVLAEKYNIEARKLFGVEDDAGIQIFAILTGSVRKAVERLN